jgi:GNAT superfamily N-acetyltransferase
LPAELARQILRLQHSAFPATADFAAQRWWHTPPEDEDLWFTLPDGEGGLAASARVILRGVGTAAGRLRVAGIGNVCSRPDLRGRGFAKGCMQAVRDWLARGGQADFGLLFTGPKVREFYAKLGWREVGNELACVDAAGRRLRTDPASRGVVMICPGRRPLGDWPAGIIDLNGPDW